MARVERTLSPPRSATSSYRGDGPGGFGTNAMNAPLGYTRAGTPLIRSVARPLPIDPKMKFESRDVTT